MSSESLFRIIKAPHVSEKSAIVADANNCVVFKVSLTATKPEIKKAVEKAFDVKVKSVRVLNVKGKAKRNRFGLVQKSNWKKAYVTLEAGQEIDFAVAG